MGLPALAVQRVGTYLTYSGRDADVSAKAARDPQRIHHMYRNLAVPV